MKIDEAVYHNFNLMKDKIFRLNDSAFREYSLVVERKKVYLANYPKFMAMAEQIEKALQEHGKLRTPAIILENGEKSPLSGYMLVLAGMALSEHFAKKEMTNNNLFGTISPRWISIMPEREFTEFCYSPLLGIGSNGWSNQKDSEKDMKKFATSLELILSRRVPNGYEGSSILFLKSKTEMEEIKSTEFMPLKNILDTAVIIKTTE